jgi:D-amino-acid dehydrogenase
LEFAKRLAAYFCNRGGEIIRSGVNAINIKGNDAISITSDEGQIIDCNHVIVAAGVWSKPFCNQLGEKVLLQSERGYNTTLPNPGVTLNRQIAFGEEKFVMTNIGNFEEGYSLRIGGAAEFAGICAPANYKRSERLIEIARRYLPHLDDKGSKMWMGQRPSTPDTLPVISRSSRYNNVYYAFGHGHGGLTMAATTGKLISQLISCEPASFDLSPFSIRRFQ